MMANYHDVQLIVRLQPHQLHFVVHLVHIGCKIRGVGSVTKALGALPEAFQPNNLEWRKGERHEHRETSRRG